MLASGIYYDLKARRTRALSFQRTKTVGKAVQLLIHDEGTEQFEKNDSLHIVRREIISAMTGIAIATITADHHIIICLDEMGSAAGPSSTARKRWSSPKTFYSS